MKIKSIFLLRRSCFKSAIIFILMSGFFISASAHTEAMQRDLQQIHRILQQIAPLIDQGIRDQDPSARVKFQFESLRRDIGEIEAGIVMALLKTPPYPRTLSPLRGDYLQAPTR